MTRRRRVTRSAAAAVRADTVERDVQFLELEKPEFLSLVGSPANRTPFKVVRDGDETVSKRRKRTDSALMSVTLPAETTEEEAAEIFEQYALDEDVYEIARDEEGVYFKRKKLDDDVETRDIVLPNGVTATVAAQTFDKHIKRSDDQPGLTITKVTFKGLDRADAEAWLESNDVTYQAEDLFAIQEDTVLVRHDMPDDVETKELELGKDTNVVAQVAQTKRDDIPQRIYRHVVENMYGRYGWGHLDFLQAMADEKFSEESWNAIYWLRDVLDNILFYSDLSLDDRLALIKIATGEFTAYMTALVEALPRNILTPEDHVDLSSQSTADETASEEESNESSTENKETADMVIKKKAEAKTDESGKPIADETVVRTDEEIAADAEQEQTDEANAQRSDEGADAGENKDDEVITMTRGDLKKNLSEEAIDGIVADQEAKRTDGINPALAEALAGITGKLDTIVERQDKTDEALASIGDETIVRGDEAGEEQEDETEEERIARDDKGWGGSIFKTA